MTAKKILLILLTAMTFLVRGQVTFERTYGGTQEDLGSDLHITSDSSYLVAGYTQSYTQGFYDLYVLKTDLCGDTLWTNSFGTPQQDYGQTVIETTDGSYYLCGGKAGAEIWLIKLDPATGDSIWSRTYPGQSYSNTRSLSETPDSGLIISGTIFLNGLRNFYLIRTDMNGDTLWTNNYGGSEAHYWLIDIVISDDSGYVMTGYYFDTTYAIMKSIAIKTDKYGIEQWKKTYGDSTFNQAWALTKVAAGGYMLLGRRRNDIGLYNIYMIRINDNGDTLWTKELNLSDDDAGHDLQQTSDGGFILTGEGQFFGWGNWDLYLIKIDSLGDILWVNGYGGSFAEYGRNVELTSDGGFAICGNTKSFGNGSNDVYLIKTDIAGNVFTIPPVNISIVDTTVLYNDSTFCIGDTVSVSASYSELIQWSTGDTTPNLMITQSGTYVVNYVNNCASSSDSITFYTMDCTPNGTERQLLYKNPIIIYPNPTSQTAILEFDNPKHESHTLTLYNTHGRLVRKVTNITSDKLTLYTADLASGLHFFQLRTNSEIRYTGKLTTK